MKRLAAVVVVALIGFAAAIVAFNRPERKGCPLTGAENASYSARFDEAVTMEQTRHALVVTRGGRPVTGSEVCINTQMVGMSGMGYSAKAEEVEPGRYEVRFQFGMAGEYRSNVVVFEEGGDPISIPLTVQVSGMSDMDGMDGMDGSGDGGSDGMDGMGGSDDGSGEMSGDAPEETPSPTG